jgi:phosphoglycerate kinase
MNKKTIKDVSFSNKNVLLRVDYNVPLLKKNGKLTVGDDVRIAESLKTINFILQQKPSRLVLMSHLGRPDGKNNPKFSLKPVVAHLSKLLKKEVLFFENYEKDQVLGKINGLQNGEIVLLENLRFYKQEELNKKAFAQKLAQLGDTYINEAFSNCHRSHASMVGIAELIPSVAGFELENEIDIISKTINHPQKPFVVIIGGAKATTKIPILEKLFTRADYVLLGGGVANTFLRAMGYNIGQSIYSPESLRIAQNLVWRASRYKTHLFLPNDVVIGRFEKGKNEGVTSIDEIPLQMQALDIGPKTRKDYAQIISQARTIIWNGPMGAIEHKDFCAGNNAIFQAVTKNSKTVSVVGGGETLSSLDGKKDLGKITHISTGGGAMLEFIEKDSLPAVEALSNK